MDKCTFLGKPGAAVVPATGANAAAPTVVPKPENEYNTHALVIVNPDAEVWRQVGVRVGREIN